MSIFAAALALFMLPAGPLTYQTDDFVINFPEGWQRAEVQESEVPHVSFTRWIDGQQVGLILMKAEGTTAEETWRQGQRSGSWEARGSRKIQLDGQPAYELDFTANDDELTAEVVFDLADAGDPLAEKVVDDTAYFLALGACGVIATVDPEMIVFGGGMAESGEPFRARIESFVKRFGLPFPTRSVKIALATLGSDAGFIGAAGCARMLVVGK